MHVARTFAMSYERLDTADETDEMALALLAWTACFAPGEAIPQELLMATVTIGRADTQSEGRIAPLIARLFGQAKSKSEDQGKREGLGDRKGLSL